ncbi:MAG: hypothetical protein LBH96_04705, partial [Candidatus Peribacteria bacterium]|nr:hypothetical protein [Candidatus Peribacteria bacterium]
LQVNGGDPSSKMTVLSMISISEMTRIGCIIGWILIEWLSIDSPKLLILRFIISLPKVRTYPYSFLFLR